MSCEYSQSSPWVADVVEVVRSEHVAAKAPAAVVTGVGHLHGAQGQFANHPCDETVVSTPATASGVREGKECCGLFGCESFNKVMPHRLRMNRSCLCQRLASVPRDNDLRSFPLGF
jgi:hypothetical protein